MLPKKRKVHQIKASPTEKRILWVQKMTLGIITILLIIVSINFFKMFLMKSNLDRFSKDSTHYSGQFNKLLLDNKISGTTRTLGLEDIRLKKLVSGEEPPDNDAILRILVSVKEQYSAAIVYALDNTGTVVGSSPYGEGKTLTGNNYVFRPYFTNAMKGNDVIYAALGVTTKKRGLYYSSPIFSETQNINAQPKIIGAIVVKMNLYEVDSFLEKVIYPAALISEFNIVFSSNNEGWLFKPLLPLNQKSLSELQESKQFSDELSSKDISPVANITESDELKIGSRNYYYKKIPIRLFSDSGSWKLFFLMDENEALPARLFLLGAFIIAIVGLVGYLGGCVSFDQKMTEKALRESERRFSDIAKTTAGWVWELDATGKLVFSNSEVENMLGYSVDELLNKNNFIKVLQSDQEFVKELLRKSFAEKKGWKHLELRRVHKDGSYRYFQSTAVPKISAGEITGFIGTDQDVTKLKRTQETLRNSIEALTHPFYVVDISNYKIIIANSAATEILSDDTTRDALSFREKGPRKDEHVSLLKRVKEMKCEQIVEYVHYNKKGRLRDFEVHGYPVFNEREEVIQMIVYSLDITDRKKAEKDRIKLQNDLNHFQKMESIGTMANGIAHNFNNIFAAIRGLLEMALMDLPGDSRIKSDLEKAIESLEEAKELSDKMLAFSHKQESGFEQVNLVDVINETCALFKISQTKPIKLVTDIDPQCGSVLARANDIKQVVMNLCNNAYQSLDKDSRVIDVSLKQVYVDSRMVSRWPNLCEGKYAQLCVKDNGGGMDESTRSRIFEPFFTTKKVGKGTGLGLYLILGIVKKHHGDIIVESQLGKGTEFKVFLPMANNNNETGEENKS